MKSVYQIPENKKGLEELQRLRDQVEKFWPFELPLLEQLGIENLPLSAGRILDVACGTGDYLKKFVERFNVTDAVGVDQSSSAIDAANASSSLQFHRYDAVEFLRDATAHSFDLILSRFFLQHISRPYAEELLKQAFRVLAPGGAVLLINTDPRYFIFDPPLPKAEELFVNKELWRSANGIETHKPEQTIKILKRSGYSKVAAKFELVSSDVFGLENLASLMSRGAHCGIDPSSAPLAGEAAKEIELWKTAEGSSGAILINVIVANKIA